MRSLEGRGLVRIGKDAGPRRGVTLYVRLVTAQDRRVDLAVAAAVAKDRALRESVTPA